MTQNPNTYQIDTAIQVQGSFINSLTGQLADPTTVILFIQQPGQPVQTLTYGTSSILRQGVGVYTYQFTSVASGTWTYKWQGTGVIIATSPDKQFIVQPSALIAG